MPATMFTRTEAQMRAALHAHILLFFKPREKPVAYQPNPPIARVVPGHEPKQRPCDCEVRPQTERQEDNVYQAHHVGHIRAEMVRPDVSGKDWGGFDHEHLRIAALARAIQSRLPYLHHCNAVYCLKDRPSCRFHREESCHLPIPCPRFFCSSVQSANHLTQIVNVCQVPSSIIGSFSLGLCNPIHALMRTHRGWLCSDACLRMISSWCHTIST